MGLNLRPILTVKNIEISYLSGKWITIDANNMLYQFLALIRSPDGRRLTDKKGRTTSHLIGLLYRTTKLITEFDIYPVFVFDGYPPKFKSKELEKRRRERQKLRNEWEQAIARHDFRTAWSKAVRMDSLTKEMIVDAKKLLSLLGLPQVQAPSEGEAQAAYMVKKGDANFCVSQDYDALLFGAPLVVRNLTFTGIRYLPSKGTAYKIAPELVVLEDVLAQLKITHDQLIQIALLMGTDYNEGVFGIGPKKALKLIRRFGSIENLPKQIKNALGEYQEIFNFFKNPPVTKKYTLTIGKIYKDRLIEFLCEEHDFNKKRVMAVLKKLEEKFEKQATLADFI
ncbi:MAG: flap endonuclease-1 [Candidatus Odinarchaeota archaeon]|nr:flap endonuclease-1 [Candidatus Odinarchaeota archaeon]